MQTLGDRLEEARKRKGLSIREAAEATKIRGDYLQKFEAGSADFDLPPLYVRGFLRTYAKYLDLDAQRLVAEFDSLMADAGRAPRRETRENYGRVEFGGNDAGGESAPAARSAGLDPVMLKYLIYGGAAIVLILVVLIVVNLFSGSAPKPTARSAAQENSAPAAQSAIIEPAATAQTVTLTALDATRVKIVREADESVVFDGALSRGETRTFRKVGVFRVTVEDRTKLRLEVNGRALEIPSFPRLATSEDVAAGRARAVNEVIPTGGNYGRFKLD